MAIHRLARTLAARPASSLRPTTLPHVRTFRATPVQRLKEDHKDPSPEEAERLKQEQVRKAEKGDGHWHEGLASSGEANVKADRQDVNDHDDHIEDLQKQTKDQADKGKI